jgi:putative acetyltransferase
LRGIDVRLATLADAEEMLQLQRAAVQYAAKDFYAPDILEAWSPPVDATRLQSFRERFVPGASWLALRGIRVLAFGSLGATRNILSSLYVHPEAQREGLGRFLLRTLENEAGGRAWASLELEASLNAVAFYEHCGYQNLALTRFTLRNGREMDAVQMRKDLGAPC